MSFESKVVLVTGASRGIGRATAYEFLKSGARVAINDRTSELVSKCIASMEPQNRLFAAPGDISTIHGCEAAVSATVELWGRIDVLINNAGVAERLSVSDTDERAYDRMMNTNVKGTYFCSRAALPSLRIAKGVIINLASEAGLNGYANLTAYCASKGAIVNLTRAMAIELAPSVRVNCVCPGVTDTEMARSLFGDLRAESEWYPMQRVGTPDEVAKAILYLASSDASFITGVALAIDGGATAGG